MVSLVMEGQKLGQLGEQLLCQMVTLEWPFFLHLLYFYFYFMFLSLPRKEVAEVGTVPRWIIATHCKYRVLL